jgi:hypothetical protein
LNDIVRNIDLVFMCSLIHMSNKSKRRGYVNPNLINQIELNPQINENNPKYKNMRLKSKITVKKKTHHQQKVYYCYLHRMDHVVLARKI